MAPATVKDRSSNAHPRRRHATPLVRRAATADGRRLTQCDGLQQSSDERPARQSPAALRTQAASAHLSPFRHSSQWQQRETSTRALHPYLSFLWSCLMAEPLINLCLRTAPSGNCDTSHATVQTASTTAQHAHRSVAGINELDRISRVALKESAHAWQ